MAFILLKPKHAQEVQKKKKKNKKNNNKIQNTKKPLKNWHD